MRITIKTLQGKPIDLEVENDDTLSDLKKKIEDTLTIAQENQKLICYGKVMNEEGKKLTEYNLKDKDFLVLMVVKVAFFDDW